MEGGGFGRGDVGGGNGPGGLRKEEEEMVEAVTRWLGCFFFFFPCRTPGLGLDLNLIRRRARGVALMPAHPFLFVSFVPVCRASPFSSSPACSGASVARRCSRSRLALAQSQADARLRRPSGCMRALPPRVLAPAEPTATERVRPAPPPASAQRRGRGRCATVQPPWLPRCRAAGVEAIYPPVRSHRLSVDGGGGGAGFGAGAARPSISPVGIH